MTTATEDTKAVNGNLQFVRGIPVTTMFRKELIEEAIDFMPGDGDIIIPSYPKTGTTWTQYIVLQILSKGQLVPSFDDLIEKIAPIIDMVGTSVVDSMTTRPRVYKHHLPYNVVKKNPKSKLIYIYRHPEDTFISSYHFMNYNGNLNFDEYFENFLSGNFSRGLYFKHVLSYLEHKDDGNILFVSYEKLQTHRREEILRIAQFLGDDYYQSLVDDASLIDKIIEHTNFSFMKNHLSVKLTSSHLSSSVPRKEINFFRKGAIGDGKKFLSKEQSERLKKVAKEILNGYDIIKEWYDE